MLSIRAKNSWLFLVIILSSFSLYPASLDPQDQTETEQTITESLRRIRTIIVIGNKLVPDSAIKARLTFSEGELFDPRKTGPSIKNIYELGRFRNIRIKAKNIGDDAIDIYIFVEEKSILKDVIFKGNKQISEKDIRKKIPFDDIRAIDPEELAKFVKTIKKLYLEKGFHRVQINAKMETDEENKATIIFDITENNRSLVKRICFEGNHHIKSKTLRSIIFTREDWIGSMLDRTGTYQPDRLEADKHMIEQLYQNSGFLKARVIDIEQEVDACGNYTITFVIEEGDIYRIKEVHAPGNDILPEEYLVARIPVRPGQLYSREMIIETIKFLEFIWGDLGYLFAHIEPSILPDDEEKTVVLSFNSELGTQVTLNKINIKGNHKTHDKVIRRQLVLEEGCLITNSGMEASRARVESLGYFDQRDGVNWKITRLDKDMANLDLIVKEAKTGNASMQLSFGGSERAIESPLGGVALEANIADQNLFGTGIKLNLTGKLSKEEQTLLFSVAQPWVCDKPIYLGSDVYHKRIGYEEFNNTQPVNEIHTGGSVTTGFMTGWDHQLLRDVFFRAMIGGDVIRYERQPVAAIFGLEGAARLMAEAQYNTVLNKLFKPGAYVSFMLHAGQDKKNHPIHPSYGHGWLTRIQAACPGIHSNIGFFKFDLDAHWYTPLIGERDLILHLHSFIGLVHPFHDKVIPYREMFHIGGPASVRGFLWGQLGPQFSVGGRNDSLGGTKGFYLNVELIFPITPDWNIKGLLFYDGGTCWATPFTCDISSEFLINNSFNYRHAVGVGVRILSPVPLSIDWGFKIDPRKGETASEVHFTMSYGW